MPASGRLRATTEDVNAAKSLQAAKAAPERVEQAFWPLPVPFLPPGISIEINSQELKGWLDLDTGEVDFSFVSEFGGKAFGGANEALKVASKMTTHALMGKVFHAVGFPLRELDSRAQLVALSSVPETGDKLQNWILQLPTDALSVLNVQMQFVMAPAT
ncbi:uncharacterized protein HaLaN_12263 [Haematococcus lacustris]|uniref:Uncharacterized protein n=1 Tax=Haematococcus lacustris TaxID=44745 RepID=A0A699ZAP9_HAELA|nr:uncharacterized protein HaLaN_12263 [Haematococcus lacustris]